MKWVTGGGRAWVVVDIINRSGCKQFFAKISWANNFLFFKSAANTFSKVGGYAQYSVVGHRKTKIIKIAHKFTTPSFCVNWEIQVDWKRRLAFPVVTFVLMRSVVSTRIAIVL